MDQTNDILALKGEIYDLSKQLQQVQGLLGQVAQLVGAQTVDEMLGKLTEAFQGSADSKEEGVDEDSEFEDAVPVATPPRKRPKTRPSKV